MWTEIDDMEVEDIHIIKYLQKKEKKKKKKKTWGKGNAKTGYRNAYNLYGGSTVFHRVLFFVIYVIYCYKLL